MCTQAVALLAGVMEARGIATACVALVKHVAEAVRPPRALAVPFPFGEALGPPGEAATQLRVLRAALHLLESPGPPPVLQDA
jgi:hypothetical protein